MALLNLNFFLFCQVTSLDGWSCVSCGAGTTYDADSQTCKACAALSVATERELNGQIFGNTSTVPPEALRNCTVCVAGTAPATAGGRCVVIPVDIEYLLFLRKR